MLVLRIVSCVVSWIVVSIVFNVLFMFHGYNMAYISLVMAPGILPFIPFFLSKPHYGYRWVYILLGIVIQVLFNFCDLLWDNIEVLLIGVVGISLFYYSFFVSVSRSASVIYCVVIFNFLFIFLLAQQFYIYNEFRSKNICFISEWYCGSECYKDYIQISCKTKEWQSEVFHGLPGSTYNFGMKDNNIFVKFEDHHKKRVFILKDGRFEEH